MARDTHPDNGIIPPLSWEDYLDYLGGRSSRAGGWLLSQKVAPHNQSEFIVCVYAISTNLYRKL
jgi:hypothetical protein